MSHYGVCNLCVIPLMSEPSHKSELISQLLFGEHFTILENRNGWTEVQTEPDHYKGWILSSQYSEISLADFQKLKSEPIHVVYDLVQIMELNSKMCPIVLGSNLPFFNNGSGKFADQSYKYHGETKNTSDKTGSSFIAENAMMYLNTPYLWGGRSPFGIDCSGLVQVVYKLSGINLKRDSSVQAQHGKDIHMLDETYPGDLAFFSNENGDINHVGILLSRDKIIHASGKVQIDNIDQYGIFKEGNKKYSHKLRMIKRIL